MKLSVIIVNFNVEYFLEQCLLSVYRALKDIPSEVIVVDNNSIDNSVEVVKKKFPKVNLVENKENVGFAKANNQAIKASKGEYVLLLNPDTVVEENTFHKTIEFMDKTPDAGGLGVKMIDGKGNFLPESKRGLPTPRVAFHKIFGLSRLFPKSKRFGGYHLGYLNDDKVHQVDILSGAFMMIRKTVLDKVGLLDESFFMYGEDIDLSYRILQGGYKNYYFPKTRIIHYKGESTKKSSVNYIFVFYRAMVIFARKHFSQKNAKIFSVLINLAIYFRAFIAIVDRFTRRSVLPIMDLTLIISGLFMITRYYQEFNDLVFPGGLLLVALPAYALIWHWSVYFSGGYDKPVKITNIIRGVIAGMAIILIIYAVLPKAYQFSRGVIFLGTAWVTLCYWGTRKLFSLWSLKGYVPNTAKKFAIVGKKDEADRVVDLLKQTDQHIEHISYVNPHVNGKVPEFAGNISQLRQISHIHKIDEIIFCARDNSSQRIIDLMSKIENRNLDYKIAHPESLYLIGSNSINTSGDMYMLNINAITSTNNIRNKRIVDIVMSLALLVSSPLLIWFMKKKMNFFKNIFSVLIGRKTWVSYSKDQNRQGFNLPRIKPGILSQVDILKEKPTGETITKLNIVYAKDYKYTTDVNIILKSLDKLDRIETNLV